MTTDQIRFLRRINDAKLTILPGNSNSGKNKSIEGAYITATKGLSSETWFIGCNPTTGELIIEST